jgi:hypothetical protein
MNESPWIEVAAKEAALVIQLQAEVTKLKEAISDLHSEITKESWDNLEEETRVVCMEIHEELWHADDA